MRLSDRQWELIEHLFPEPKRRGDGRGRPSAANRQCVEGILWVLRTGARWRDLPAEYPSGVTCWRRLRRWEDEGVWLEAWQQLLAALNHQQLLEWDETFLDGSFVSAKKGRCCRKNQAREGDKVDGTGRWPGHSFGSATGECFTGGSHARRSNGGSGPRPVLGTGSSAAETETDNCRPG